MYLLKLALRPWRMAAVSQLVSAVAMGFLLSLAGFLIWLQGGLKPVLSHLQGEQVITAYLEPSVDAKDETRVVDSIRLAVGAKDVDVRFTDARQFVTNLKGQFPELSRELEDLGPEMPTVVPRYITVSGMLSDAPGVNADGERDSRPVLERVRGVSGIEAAETSKDRFKPVVGAFQTLRWVARLLAGGLCLALLAGLVQLARTNSHFHGDSLELLKLWGASEWTLRIPAALSGLSIGAAGGLFAALAWTLAGRMLSLHVRALSPMLHDLSPAPGSYGITLLLAGALLGAVSGILAASTRGTREASV